MTDCTIMKRPWPAATVLAALALAGCSGTNIGSSWQCPLAQVGTCDSVAGADPAVPQAASVPQAAPVPDAAPADGMTIREPLYRARGEAVAGRQPKTVETPEDCVGGCDPFAWLARLFGADRNAAAASSPKPAPGGSPAGAADEPGGDPDAGPAADPFIETASEPGAPESGAGLRTEEVVGRIWIAPFVDANGVYREASHVRVVLEPAGWRVP